MQEKKQCEWETLSIHSLTFVPETSASAAEDTTSHQDEGRCFANTPESELQQLAPRALVLQGGEAEVRKRAGIGTFKLLQLQWQSS